LVDPTRDENEAPAGVCDTLPFVDGRFRPVKNISDYYGCV